MAVNRGKQFEKQIARSLKLIPDCFTYRLIDSCNGYAGVYNICDFLVFKSPYLFFFECKSTQSGTWNIKNLTKNQYNDLLVASTITDCIAGILLWFAGHHRTVFIEINELQKYVSTGRKSIAFKHLNEIKHFVVPSTQRLVLDTYQIDNEWLMQIGDKYAHEG